ncbi:MAG: PEP-CTERM sorting domain-containing protein [Planctomycetota bacterium]|nr:PEP-CTERM sorting domain-containing protein [Planctomycetota bacterium]
MSTSGSIQNGADVASSGAIVNITGGTYNEDVTVFTALTTKFSGDTTLGGTLDIRNNVDLDGAATYLALNALAVTSEAKLDVNGIPVYVGGDVETTLGDWISDGRLFSTTWGASIKASYRESLDRTEVTPEPATLALLALGGLAILGRKRR